MTGSLNHILRASVAKTTRAASFATRIAHVSDPRCPQHLGLIKKEEEHQKPNEKTNDKTGEDLQYT